MSMSSPARRRSDAEFALAYASTIGERQEASDRDSRALRREVDNLQHRLTGADKALLESQAALAKAEAAEAVAVP